MCIKVFCYIFCYLVYCIILVSCVLPRCCIVFMTLCSICTRIFAMFYGQATYDKLIVLCHLYYGGYQYILTKDTKEILIVFFIVKVLVTFLIL